MVQVLPSGYLHQLFSESAVLQNLGDPGQGLQMNAGGILWCHKEEKKMGRLPVHGVKIKSFTAPPERNAGLSDAGKLAVRNRHPIPDPRTSETLSFQQDLHKGVLVQRWLLLNQGVDQLFQNPSLVFGLQVRNDILFMNEVG